MKENSTIQERFSPITILTAGVLLFSVSVFLLLQTVYPFVWLFPLALLTIMVVLCGKPMIGVYALIVLYPLGGSAFVLHSRLLDGRFVFFDNILAFFLLFVMLFRMLHHRHQRSVYQYSSTQLSVRWCGFLLALFITWSAIVVAQSDNYLASLHGFWRLLSCFIIIAYLVFCLDSYDKFIKVMACFCSVSVFYALSAIYATNHAFKVTWDLFYFPEIIISLQVVLFNLPSSFESVAVGLRSGVGFAAKHDLSMLLVGGTLFAFFFYKNNPSFTVKCILGGAMLFFMTIVYQVFSKLTVAAMFFVALSICLVIPAWRKLIFTVFMVLLVMNIGGCFCSSLTKPVHMKNMESTLQRAEEIGAKSKYEPSSIAGRQHIWARTVERIFRQSGFGSGPESMHRDKSFGYPHSHNIFLSFAVEYGLPGALLIVIFFLMIGHAAFKSVFVRPDVHNKVWVLQMIFVALSLHSLLVYSFDIPIFRKHIWFMIGLLLASINVSVKTKTAITY